MKASTMLRLAQGIQIQKLSGNNNYTFKELSNVSGVSVKTIQRNKDVIEMLEFSMFTKEYDRCIIQI